MNHRFLAVCLFSWAACTLGTAIVLAVLAVRGRRPVAGAAGLVLLASAAVLANAGADLWGAAS